MNINLKEKKGIDFYKTHKNKENFDLNKIYTLPNDNNEDLINIIDLNKYNNNNNILLIFEKILIIFDLNNNEIKNKINIFNDNINKSDIQNKYRIINRYGFINGKYHHRVIRYNNNNYIIYNKINLCELINLNKLIIQTNNSKLFIYNFNTQKIETYFDDIKLSSIKILNNNKIIGININYNNIIYLN